MSETFVLQTPQGRRIHGSLELGNRAGRRPTVVICHGFKGFQEWGFFPYLATLLAERGFTAVRFNFPGTGMRPGDDLVTDLAAFRTARLSQDLEDLLWLLDHLGDLEPDRIDTEQIGLFGHSRGGGTSILASAHDSWLDRVRALVTWSAVSTFDRTSDEEKVVWRRDGEVPVTNARTGQQLALGVEVLHDLEANVELLDIPAAAAKRRTPWLIVHGEQDETVSIEEAKSLAQSAREPAALEQIPGAGHTFEVGHPFAGPSAELIQAMNATQTWFRRHLT